ncbi:MAG: polyhydroxyalkanoic acid system family protein [Deltaproteobacteria bacterium]
MATIDMSRAHTLGLEEAKVRSNQILERLKGNYGIKGTWTGDKFDITAPAKGTFTVTANNVRLEIDLPFMLRPIKGKIEAKVTEEFDRSLT